MTDQSERVFLQNIPHLLSLLFTLKETKTIFTIQFLTNLCKVFNKLCKVCATAALN